MREAGAGAAQDPQVDGGLKVSGRVGEPRPLPHAEHPSTAASLVGISCGRGASSPCDTPRHRFGLRVHDNVGSEHCSRPGRPLGKVHLSVAPKNGLLSCATRVTQGRPGKELNRTGFQENLSGNTTIHVTVWLCSHCRGNHHHVLVLDCECPMGQDLSYFIHSSNRRHGTQ